MLRHRVRERERRRGKTDTRSSHAATLLSGPVSIGFRARKIQPPVRIVLCVCARVCVCVYSPIILCVCVCVCVSVRSIIHQRIPFQTKPSDSYHHLWISPCVLCVCVCWDTGVLGNATYPRVQSPSPDGRKGHVHSASPPVRVRPHSPRCHPRYRPPLKYRSDVGLLGL